jgi:hypothetical protein
MIAKLDAAADLKQVLLRTRNKDGGWGYYAGKASRLEPTCWALLALGPEVDHSVLRNWPLKDGLLVDPGSPTPNVGFHGLALLTLLARRVEHVASNGRLIGAIENAKGIKLENAATTRQRNELQAWSWIKDTFSWAEPTAWCLIALKKARALSRAVNAARIADAELVLFDRSCLRGGWNYGNSNVFGKELPAYVSTTALGLLALRDHQNHQIVAKSLKLLQHEWSTEPSGLALGLSAMAFRHFGVSSAQVTAALDHSVPTILTVGNLHVTSVALYALTSEHDVFSY